MKRTLYNLECIVRNGVISDNIIYKQNEFYFLKTSFNFLEFVEKKLYDCMGTTFLSRECFNVEIKTRSYYDFKISRINMRII